MARSIAYPLHFTIPPLTSSSSSSSKAGDDDGVSTGTTTADAATAAATKTAPVVVGHLTHAHEAALNFHNNHQHNDDPANTYARFLEHETERYASWQHPRGPKAAQAIPALVGDWACAPLHAPRPRDPIRGGTIPPQPPAGTYTQHWEERGAIFWHVPTVGSSLKDAAQLIWQMEDCGALPLCNEATNVTRSQIRFLGRYDINDYGVALPSNQALPDDDPHKVTIGYDEESTTHFDILLASTTSHSYPVSLGTVCHFCTPDAYWDHYMDVSARRDAMNYGSDDDDDDDENALDIDEVAFANGLQILSATTGGALCVLRKQARMHLRAFLYNDDKNDTAYVPAVKAFIFYGAADEEFFSEWRVGGKDIDDSCPVVPGRGLPPGGILSRNDEVDNLYGYRPFNHAAVQSFFFDDSMMNDDDDQALAQWWNSLPRPLLPHFVCRLIRGCYLSLWQRLERVSPLSSPKGVRALHLFVDEHCQQVALNVPELNPNYQRAVAFEHCPAIAVEDRNEMAARVAQALMSRSSTTTRTTT